MKQNNWGAYEPNSDKIPASAWLAVIPVLVAFFLGFFL